MSYTTMSILIIGMAVATFVCKASFFLLGSRVVFPSLLKDALEFVPVTVLTAIIVPLVVAPEGTLDLSWRNPQLIATLAAIGIAATARNPLLTIVAALATFFAWRFVVLA
jgi:branched-subunit amino acid transport protein